MGTVKTRGGYLDTVKPRVEVGIHRKPVVGIHRKPRVGTWIQSNPVLKLNNQVKKFSNQESGEEVHPKDLVLRLVYESMFFYCVRIGYTHHISSCFQMGS